MATKDPAATKAILEIPVTKIMTVHRAPYRVPVFSDDTGELVPKPGQEDKPAVEQEIEMQAADTASLFDDLLRKYPRLWAQFQGDGGQIAGVSGAAHSLFHHAGDLVLDHGRSNGNSPLRTRASNSSTALRACSTTSGG